MSNMEDFDLLAGHDFGNTQQLDSKKYADQSTPKVLIWQKVETPGFQPAAREVSLFQISFNVSVSSS